MAALVAAVVAAVVVTVPLPGSRGPAAPTAIRLVPFDGLMTPWVLPAPPAGLSAAPFEGRQGSTTAAYLSPEPGPDSVDVGHTAAPPESNSADLPNARVQHQEADGTWVLVAGYGRFADDAVVAALLATARPAPRASPLDVGLAPSGWQLEGFHDLEPGQGVVRLTSPGDDPGGPDAISVIRQRTSAADFPVAYRGPGPLLRSVSVGRPGMLVHGAESWTLRLHLRDGGSLVLSLPVRMTREQVQRFADGVTAPPRASPFAS